VILIERESAGMGGNACHSGNAGARGPNLAEAFKSNSRVQQTLNTSQAQSPASNQVQQTAPATPGMVKP
jgi:hypothetical protein